MNPAIGVDSLILSYGKEPVLNGLSFEVNEGAFFIVIGPNGSGKTSLLKAICGIVRPRAGAVNILGKPLAHYSRRAMARTVALVPQLMPVDFPFTVSETVLMGRSPHLGMLGLERDADLEKAHQAMAFTRILHLADRKLDELSGGERQRVIIARAICQEPGIMLLDEPTASLDLAHQTMVMDLMERLQREKGITVVMVSHDVNLAAMYGSRLLLLKDGKVASMGNPVEVLTFERLEEVYGCVLLVDENPLGKVPRITPVPNRHIGSQPKKPK